MGRLFLFVYQYRAFFTFLSLEVICVWLIIQNNQYQSSKYFNTSNAFVASLISTSNGVKEYLGLREINRELAEENARLRQVIDRQNNRVASKSVEAKDSSTINSFEFVSAKVVNNSVNLSKNYITIDKGKLDGISPGMAVISARGAVGKVKTVSDHFSVVISLLNIDEQVSSILTSGGYFCTTQWDGSNPLAVEVKYLPRHVIVHKGDTVITSGYNAVFPEGIMVGTVESFELREEALFYDIRVKLAQDFLQLSFVEVVKSKFKQERDSIEMITKREIK
jgi:rod shape-determining protein MreC